MSASPIQSPDLLNNPTRKGLCPVAGDKQANRQLHLLPSSLLGCEAPWSGPGFLNPPKCGVHGA